jgi:glycosyltransferase involved in cell wall biosynthesis
VLTFLGHARERERGTAAAVPRVLFVTGAYYPEISAAAVQCRAVADALSGRAVFSVLTTALDPALPPIEMVDGVLVLRVTVDVQSRISKAIASVRLVRRMLQARRTYDMVHVHGVSQKNVPVTLLARMLRKPVVLTLHTSGQDEPAQVRYRGAFAYWAFQMSDLVLCVSPDLQFRCRAAVPDARVRLTPNGVDTKRFRPADADERRALRRAMGWPETQPVVLFVGFFSRDKRPDLLFRAWRRLEAAGLRPKLVFVGAKSAPYHEIDPAIARQFTAEARRSGRSDDLAFVEPTHRVERYFRAADVFVLPSIREAQPLALLEAMACGLPAIATHLPGATDVLIDDGRNGRLVPADDEAVLAAALQDVLTNQPAARLMGERARETVLADYDIRRTAERWLSAYTTVLGRASLPRTNDHCLTPDA